jgi:hypothetical protein
MIVVQLPSAIDRIIIILKSRYGVHSSTVHFPRALASMYVKRAMQTPPYVIAADRDFVSVKTNDPSAQRQLLQFGFLPAPEDNAHEFIKHAKDKAEKAAIFDFLRPLGVHWSRGREWSPAEIFEWLRDQNLIQGTFKTIAWTSPTTWVTREE